MFPNLPTTPISTVPVRGVSPIGATTAGLGGATIGEGGATIGEGGARARVGVATVGGPTSHRVEGAAPVIVLPVRLTNTREITQDSRLGK